MATDKHHGISRHRLTDNPEEQRFADAWQAHNDTGRTLDWLLDPEYSARTGYPPHVEDREREVAATVVQWLGSHVGQGFLRDLGYVRADDEREAIVTMLRRQWKKEDGYEGARQVRHAIGEAIASVTERIGRVGT